MAEQRNLSPLIRWIGGKQRLAPRIASILAPAIANAVTYYEPFVGAGGFLLHLLSTGALEGKRVIASDTNIRLIDFHKTVQDSPAELIAELQEFIYLGGGDAYHKLRDEYNNSETGATRVHRAAVFYVLMRKSFNGLYRENAEGRFNIAIGRPSGALAFKISDDDETAIMAVSRATAGVTFVARDYLEAIESAAITPAHSFIYADPPYEGTFNSYSPASYSTAALFDAIAKSGAAAAISNSDSAAVLSLEKLPACVLSILEIKYSVGASATARGKKVELLIQVAAAPTAVRLTDDEVDAILAPILSQLEHDNDILAELAPCGYNSHRGRVLLPEDAELRALGLDNTERKIAAEDYNRWLFEDSCRVRLPGELTREEYLRQLLGD